MTARLAGLPAPARAGLIVATMAAGLRLLYGPGAIGYDANYALVWGRQLIHGQLPQFESAVAPTPHPLANLLSAPLSLLGDGAMDVVVLITIVSLAALAWFAYRLGARAFSPVVGVIFAAILLTRPALANETLQAIVDIPFLALVVAAGYVAIGGDRRPRTVLLLLALAGLLRPEGWPLALLYLALTWRRVEGRARVQAVALALAAPVIWVLFDAVVTGNPLYSLHGTQALAAQLERPRGLSAALHAEPDYLRLLLGGSVTWIGLGGALAGLVALYERALLPAAIALLGLVGFLVLGAAGLPVLTRYLLVPAVVVALFAGVAVAGWTALSHDSPLRRPWSLAGTAAGIALLAFLPGTASDLRGVREYIDGRRNVQHSLRALARDPAALAAIERCHGLAAPDHRPIPLLAYWLDRKPSSIQLQLATPVQGTAYVSFASIEVARSLSLQPTFQPVLPETTKGLHAVARNPSWILYASCSA